MKAVTKNFWNHGVLASAALASALVIGACGGTSSNPVQGYSAIRVTQPNNKVQQDQDTGVNGFAIDVVGTGDFNLPPDFIEDQAGSFQLHVRNLQKATIQSYILSLTKGPAGLTVTRSGEPDVFNVQWTPPSGTIPADKTQFPVEIVVTALPAQYSNNYWANKGTPASFSFRVVRDDRQPQITSISGLKDAVTEGDLIPFTVEVSDPSGSDTAPNIYFAPYDTTANRENYKGDGAQFILPGFAAAPEKLGPGRWRLHYLFDARSVDTKGGSLPLPLDKNLKPEKQANGINLWFVAKAINALGNQSTPQQLHTTINYSVQTPVVTWLRPAGDIGPQPAYSEATIGKDNTIAFTVAVPNNRGALSVSLESRDFANWPGSPTFDNCKAAAQAGFQTCTIAWSIPCGVKLPKTKRVTLKAVANFANAQKSTSIVRDIHILSAEAGSCGVPSTNSASTKLSGSVSAPSLASQKPALSQNANGLEKFAAFQAKVAQVTKDTRLKTPMKVVQPKMSRALLSTSTAKVKTVADSVAHQSTQVAKNQTEKKSIPTQKAIHPRIRARRGRPQRPGSGRSASDTKKPSTSSATKPSTTKPDASKPATVNKMKFGLASSQAPGDTNTSYVKPHVAASAAAPVSSLAHEQGVSQ